MVLVKGEYAYYVAQISQQTGAPGAWTKVTTGFVAAKTPNDLFVETPNRVYFVADGGYIVLQAGMDWIDRRDEQQVARACVQQKIVGKWTTVQCARAKK